MFFCVFFSLSEYGCIESRRKWGEVASLHSTDMSSVFSGGLVYEYTSEGTGYGIVELKNGEAEELEDYAPLKAAFAKQKDPSGDGGYKKSGSPSKCPPSSPQWEVTSNNLPALPAPAKAFMSNGAGKGVGLDGTGSQNAGTPSETTATPGSGTVTGKSGAAGLRGSGFSTVSVVVSALLVSAFGASLL